MIQIADSGGPDQTARMRRLIWAVAVRICPKARFRIRGPYVICCSSGWKPKRSRTTASSTPAWEYTFRGDNTIKIVFDVIGFQQIHYILSIESTNVRWTNNTDQIKTRE